MRASRNKKKKWLRISFVIASLILLTIGGYAYYLFYSVEKTAENIHLPIDRKVSEKRTEKVKFTERDPISVLLMGVDEREGDRGRSDTLIVLTVNPNQKSMKMVSIPRDTRTTIIGKGTEDKINHAYAFGGPEMTIKTVEHFLNIPVDYFIQVNMESFRDIVNAVGGVTVNSQFAFEHGGFSFKEGENTLTGDAALAFSRMRYEDPRGDFGRQDRQRQIIKAVIEKGASVSSLSKFDNVLAVIGENTKTNLTFDEMVDIQSNYKDARHNLEQSMVTGKGTKINGIYYYVVPDNERKALSTKLREHLELK